MQSCFSLHYGKRRKHENLKKLHRMVTAVKRDGEVGLAYMKSFEIEQMWINKGIEQGISQGIAQGIEQGISQGISQGITQGIEQGRSEERVNTLREKARADRLERELRKLRKLRRR